jgi:hypothetical protein
MVSRTLTDKFLNSVIITLIARATLALMPVVGSFLIWLGVQAYGNIQKSIELQAAQISQMQLELQDHQLRLENGKAARIDFQTHADQQFTKLDTQLSEIADRLTSVNNAVIRVQTIVETRLPTKDSFLLRLAPKGAQ